VAAYRTGDCYIAAGGLTLVDDDGFMCIDPFPDPEEAARRVLSFAKVCHVYRYTLI
jgi:DNA replicative helicase MCM subunit Mcm2 (Cdc46/Mcm family)